MQTTEIITWFNEIMKARKQGGGKENNLNNPAHMASRNCPSLSDTLLSSSFVTEEATAEEIV